MCGIVGYVGERPVLPLLINGLKRLEYRGYDSAGVAAIEDGEVWVRKRKGKIRELEQEIDGIDLKSCIGIGHTRWATHGVPSTQNAHPHCDCQNRIALVHNGIIENYVRLKEQLEAKDLDELKSLASLAANTEEQEEKMETLNYVGQGDPTKNETEEEPMDVPVLNFGSEKK